MSVAKKEIIQEASEDMAVSWQKKPQYSKYI